MYLDGKILGNLETHHNQYQIFVCPFSIVKINECHYSVHRHIKLEVSA